MFYAIRTLGPLANPFARPVPHSFADKGSRDAFVAAVNAPLSAYDAAPVTAADAARYAADQPIVNH